MTASITNADIKASGEIAVGPLFPRKEVAPSVNSIDKTIDDDVHAVTSHQATKNTGTFETFGDPTFYTPIEQYEGKHRYDPSFEWAPREEKKLVRKVSLFC